MVFPLKFYFFRPYHKKDFQLRSTVFSIVFLLSGATAICQNNVVEEGLIADRIFDYTSYGFMNLSQNKNLDSAEYYFGKALDMQYAYEFYEKDDRVALNHTYLASIHRINYRYSEALHHLSLAEDIMRKTDSTHLLLASIYHNKGNIFKIRNDLYRTKEYYDYALEIMLRNNYRNPEHLASIFSNYIKLLLRIGENELAKEQLSRIDTKTLQDNPNLASRVERTMAETYSQLGEYEQALLHFQKARSAINQLEGKQTEAHLIYYYLDLIDFYMQFKQLPQALLNCDNALSLMEKTNRASLPNYPKIYTSILYRQAKIQFQLSNIDRALDQINRAMANTHRLINNYRDDAGPVSVSRQDFSSNLLELQILKSRVLKADYLKTNSLNALIEANIAFEEAIQSLELLKLAMENEDSRIWSTASILGFYKEAIHSSILLFEESEDEQYLEQAFLYSERSKSFTLYSEINEMEAIEFAGLPKTIREKERRLNGQIHFFEEKLYSEHLSAEPDASAIRLYREKLFHLKDDYNDLKQEIETISSKYFKLRYNPDFITLEELREKLPHNEALVEYVLSDSMLITFVIDKNGVNVLSQELEPGFAEDCRSYYQVIQGQDFGNHASNDYMQIVSLGRKLYSILFEPVLEYTDQTSFTIVPDGAISYVPFEALLSGDTDPWLVNYRALPYLIYDYSVGYTHTSTMMFSERLKSKSPKEAVLAFAPEYYSPYKEKDLDIDMDAVRQVLKDENYLGKLHFTTEEVQGIGSSVPAKVFLNTEATEKNFKRFAPDYNVLHLAMHTIMRDDNPLYSHLAFTNMECGDTTEDNRLYAYEIYNMKLNAQMAVLSACSSGFGEMKEGEGMMSLARGFIYAGCPSIVMTLWQISDRSSSDLMTSFYHYLKKGKSKQDAMRLAKIDYLKDADDLTANPYFWSAFVVVGNSDPIYKRTAMCCWIVIVLIFSVSLALIQYRKRWQGKLRRKSGDRNRPR
ncbi:MAG: hypothetical protein CSA96_08100 [Bacteroidetes bacterium]|nr:MAG: hypothetical protein CSA96_08100 [Bacteroidota bacterium]